MLRGLQPLRYSQLLQTNQKFLFLGGYAFICAALLLFHSYSTTRFSQDRTLNEIAHNGTYSFFYAAYTRDLDYSAFYRTLPSEVAYARARTSLTSPHKQYIEQGPSITQRVAGDPSAPRSNLVVVLEESFGSEFSGYFGGAQPSWTPELDRLAKEGMSFTRFYASGNRTVRGLEGVLSSFPPLPADSIVKRHLTENRVETLARTLKRDGYKTLFIYGGRGTFDGMKSFTVTNGFDRFIEQKDYPNPSFTTIWGVADEDVFARAVEEMDAFWKNPHEPFLVVILSVSNHRPYTYPTGRIPEDPNLKSRHHAVRYSDWALGQFFEAVRKKPYFQKTIFAALADHGARVYGSEKIPIHSYEIPFFILAPGYLKKPTVINTLGCSLDVAPTLLGLLNRPYESVFFGNNLLRPTIGRVFIHHNRDIGLLENNKLVVLSINKETQFYRIDPHRQLFPLMDLGEEERRLEQDAIALFQVADDLYNHERFRVETPAPIAKAGD